MVPAPPRFKERHGGGGQVTTTPPPSTLWRQGVASTPPPLPLFSCSCLLPLYKTLAENKTKQLRQQKWAWAPYSNSARGADPQPLYRWNKVGIEFMDYPYARFDTQLESLDYTDEVRAQQPRT